MFASPRLFASMVPEDYRPLLACISPGAFKVVDWKKILSDIPMLTRRLNDSRQAEPLVAALNMRMPEGMQCTQDKLPGKAERSVKLGDDILELYFTQIFNPQGVFLDMRVKNFSVEGEKIWWRPGNFWMQWSESFRSGLTKIYVGYYTEKPKLLREGLFEVGLVDEKMSEEQVVEVEGMLLSHIGGDFKAQKFMIGHFTKSFETFFDFLLKNKIRLSADFLYLGIYLASLYHGLEELGGAYNVQAAFQKAFEKSDVRK